MQVDHPVHQVEADEADRKDYARVFVDVARRHAKQLIKVLWNIYTRTGLLLLLLLLCMVMLMLMLASSTWSRVAARRLLHQIEAADAASQGSGVDLSLARGLRR